MSRASINAFEATVIGIEDLSPAFRRITFGGPGLAGFGVTDHPRDLRIKLVIPQAARPLPLSTLWGSSASRHRPGPRGTRRGCGSTRRARVHAHVHGPRVARRGP
ncbi:siderophore-interacting protein [Brevibacterium casei]|nr:siderophore-interacting protein [Brevibacterium casei]